mmetsp:Transcript_56453/g.138713  ORF Transcript_56453/g.138713 Transcript_56453/m.138713 type:complete len:476 (-) Transcript_56453:545-1972(-)
MDIAALTKSPSTLIGALRDYDIDDVDTQERDRIAAAVKDILKAQELLPKERIDEEVNHFVFHLGLDPNFFVSLNNYNIATHVTSLYASKMLAAITGRFKIDLSNEVDGHAVHAIPSEPGRKLSPSRQLEYDVETRYLHEGYRATDNSGRALIKTDIPYRLQCYRTKGAVAPDSDVQLRMYVLDRPKFAPNAPEDSRVNSLAQLRSICDVTFWSQSTTNTRTILQRALNKATMERKLGPVIEGHYDVANNEYRLVIVYRHGSTHSFFSGMTDLYHSYEFYSTKKYVEQFSNGFVAYSLYVRPFDETVTHYEEENAAAAAAAAHTKRTTAPHAHPNLQQQQNQQPQQLPMYRGESDDSDDDSAGRKRGTAQAAKPPAKRKKDQSVDARGQVPIGAECACRTRDPLTSEVDWILGKVVAYSHETKRYTVEDAADDERDKPQREKKWVTRVQAAAWCICFYLTFAFFLAQVVQGDAGPD